MTWKLEEVELDGDWMGKILQTYSSQIEKWRKFGDRKALISRKFTFLHDPIGKSHGELIQTPLGTIVEP